MNFGDIFEFACSSYPDTQKGSNRPGGPRFSGNYSPFLVPE